MANKAEEIAGQHLTLQGGWGQGRGPEHGQTSRGAHVGSWRSVLDFHFFWLQGRKRLFLKEHLQARFCSLPSHCSDGHVLDHQVLGSKSQGRLKYNKGDGAGERNKRRPSRWAENKLHDPEREETRKFRDLPLLDGQQMCCWDQVG